MSKFIKSVILAYLTLALFSPNFVCAIETITSGYQYRFSESGEWREAPGLPFNFSDRTGNKVFIKRSIPDKLTHLLIKKAFGRLTLRLNNNIFYKYGKLGHDGFLNPRDFPFHLVKIPNGRNRTIEFIVEGQSSAIGIDVLTIGSEREIYGYIFDNDIYSVVFSFILIFIAFSMFVLALRIRRNNRRLFLVFSVFAFSSGLWIISTTHIRQWLYSNTIVWHYADYGLKSITALSMAMFIDIVLGPGLFKLNKRIWQFQTLFFFYFIFLCIWGSDLFEYNNLFNILVSIYFLLWIPLFIYKAAKKNSEARFLLTGLVVFFIVAFLDSLYAAGIMSIRIPATFGILAFVLCCGLILVVKIYQVFLSIESYSVDLEKADKIKDDFLANTSHDLLTPLNGIIGLADSLVRGIAGKLSQEAIENLNLIIVSGRRLSNLVHDLLDLSLMNNKELRIRKEPVSIRQIADVVIKLSRTLLKNDQVVMINSVPKDLPAALGDEDRLQQVLFNLVGNAIKFTNKGAITVSAEETGDQIAVTVADTGIGISEQEQQIVFDSFKKLDTSSVGQNQGTGLGLSISRLLIELHGGSIEVSSDLGKGSRFTFCLPKTSSEMSMNNTEIKKDVVSRFTEEPVLIPTFTHRERNPSAGKQNGLTILVVDDDPINQVMMVNQLSLYNYKIIQANNGYEAIDCIENKKPDIVLLDLMMPDINGLEVTRILRRNHPLDKLPIILVTAKNRISDFVMAFESGVNDYVTKPINIDELISRIRLHEELLKKNNELNAYHKDLERLVKQRTAELETSLKEAKLARDEARLANSVKTTFLANISHELRTPMQGIIGFSKFGVSKGNTLKVNKALEYFENISTSAERLMKLLNDILDLSKLESGKYEYKFNFEKLSLRVISVIEEQSAVISEKNINIDFKIPEDESRTMLDVDKIMQVVRNLIANSIKFSEPGQTINIRISEEDSHIHFSIADNGVGIPEDELESVFEKFKQSSRTMTNAGGTGLGLAICKEIVLRHDGLMWAENNPDGGSIFKFQIPIRLEPN
ncbi:MAG: response regulator [Deltaproteobacteria bacterium]|nr:response regulator [Deltaproteobacteria bacterium]